jgi:hypothetical protein
VVRDGDAVLRHPAEHRRDGSVLFLDDLYGVDGI